MYCDKVGRIGLSLNVCYLLLLKVSGKCFFGMDLFIEGYEYFFKN